MNQMPPDAYPGQTPYPSQPYPQQPYPQQPYPQPPYPSTPYPPQGMPQYPYPPTGAPPYASTPYMQPGMPMPVMPMQQKTNGLAVTAMILGIVGILLALLSPILGFILGITGVIMGHISFGQINTSGNTQGGRGMAIAGFITGYVALAIAVINFLLAMAIYNANV